MRNVLFPLLLSIALLPEEAQAQLWRYPDPCAEVSAEGWGAAKPAQSARKPPCRPRPVTPRYTVAPDSVLLVQRCQNRLAVSAALSRDVTFSAEGATVVYQARRRQLLIVPKGPTVVLLVKRGPQPLTRLEFEAVVPPLPELKCWLSDMRNAIICRGAVPDTVSQPNRRFELVLRAVPAAAFATAMPVDARYRVGHFLLTVLRGGQPVGSVRPADGEINLTQLPIRLQAGDQLLVQVQDVQRMNFRGEIERTAYSQQFRLTVPR